MFDMSKTYKITFADGTVLEGLSVNGDNFVSKTILDPDIFRPENCRGLVINDGEKDEIHDYMEPLVTGVMFDTEYWFALFDSTFYDPGSTPESDMTILQMQADIEYIAMMTGVEL